MLLKLLGVTIATGKDREAPKVETTISPVDKVTGTAVSSRLSFGGQRAFSASQSESKEVHVDFTEMLHPITKSIPWPNPGKDPWKETFLRAAILDFDRAAKQGHFNVCPFSDLKSQLGLILTFEGDLAYRKMRALHCVDFSVMADDVLASLLPLIKAFFNTRKLEIDTVVKPTSWEVKSW